jgi:peptidoglycan-associated lipoprotein
MSHVRLPLLALALAVTACAANPKTLNPSTDVVDGVAGASAPPAPMSDPAPEPAPAEPGPATSDCSLVRVRFAFDSAQLGPDAMRALREDAKCITDRQATSLLIEGHCDERGTAQYNVALGARRAEAVRRYLADLGVKAKLDAVSFGKELPLTPGTGEAAWAQNRRAEMRLPGDRRSDGTVVAGR